VGLVGGAGESREALVDQLLSLQQGKEGGLYTTISHHDDGDLPQQILVVQPEETQLTPSRLADLVDGRLWTGQNPLTSISGAAEGASPDAPSRGLLEQLLHLLAPVDQGA
jgi:hypothetical protein